MSEFQHDGNLREGMKCPKCIHEKKKVPGKLKFLSGGAFASVVVFGCTECNFRQEAYDNVSMSLGCF